MRMLLWVASFALVAGCQTSAPAGYQDIKIDTTELLEAASVGPDDVFEVRVHGHADLTGLHRVSSSGHIDFPLIGRVKVGGLSSTQIADAIGERLKDGYLQRPVVTVYIKERNSKKVFVLGQVQKPGTFLYEDNMNIVQAISLAGGFGPLAERDYTIVKRVMDGVEKSIPVPVERILTEKAANFLLRPGDIIFVPESVL